MSNKNKSIIDYECESNSITTLYYESCCLLSDIRWDILVKVWIQSSFTTEIMRC